MNLDVITQDEYKKMIDFWKRDIKHYYTTDVYARIQNPIMVKTSSSTIEHYINLFFDFKKAQFAYEMRVNKNGKWEGKTLRGMTRPKIEHLAATAANDRFKKGYLEMRFKEDPCSKERIVLGFIEPNKTSYRGSIIGYEVMIPVSLQWLVNIGDPNEELYDCDFIKGIWVPHKEYQEFNANVKKANPQQYTEN